MRLDRRGRALEKEILHLKASVEKMDYSSLLCLNATPFAPQRSSILSNISSTTRCLEDAEQKRPGLDTEISEDILSLISLHHQRHQLDKSGCHISQYLFNLHDVSSHLSTASRQCSSDHFPRLPGPPCTCWIVSLDGISQVYRGDGEPSPAHLVNSGPT
ncbi:hypothetical protein M422DRAFT_29516 [Sphaerobolus stellatus SS14]|uniref:Uncharacterized protein n=1 Tax=Sphaerobolus stellatus (strain SS14) TaxID=990650 RepID=A0A0C9W2H5_SPHS4|nr:hypothetical protein M422DRAFT_29516 [Sphaerobolus stellatus SS14]